MALATLAAAPRLLGALGSAFWRAGFNPRRASAPPRPSIPSFPSRRPSGTAAILGRARARALLRTFKRKPNDLSLQPEPAASPLSAPLEVCLHFGLLLRFTLVLKMLILASASPRRHELLLAAGIDHIVRPSSVPEIRRPGEPPLDFVRRMAEEKARAVKCRWSDIVLGADTVVALDNEVFGKPKDEEDSRRMLRLLSGRQHRVHTGIFLAKGNSCLADVSTTQVLFSELTNEEISEYTRSGEPVGKAGAYAIQGLASKFVVSLEGSYQNVVGLPVSLVYRHLRILSS